ncbi:hypothetical protein XENOCAPTIV_004061, partial [Xenoophorus captivus]
TKIPYSSCNSKKLHLLRILDISQMFDINLNKLKAISLQNISSPNKFVPKEVNFQIRLLINNLTTDKNNDCVFNQNSSSKNMSYNFSFCLRSDKRGGDSATLHLSLF